MAATARKIVAKPFLYVIVCVGILFMSKCRGTVSKALLMSIPAISERGAGVGALGLSSVVCVMLVRRVEVECLGLKPCCEGERGM